MGKTQPFSLFKNLFSCILFVPYLRRGFFAQNRLQRRVKIQKSKFFFIPFLITT
jgi:hypothetical protein